MTIPTRSARECIEAALANLTMASNAALRHTDNNNELAWNFDSGVQDGLDQAIQLIRVECASFLGDKP